MSLPTMGLPSLRRGRVLEWDISGRSLGCIYGARGVEEAACVCIPRIQLSLCVHKPISVPFCADAVAPTLMIVAAGRGVVPKSRWHAQFRCLVTCEGEVFGSVDNHKCSAVLHRSSVQHRDYPLEILDELAHLCMVDGTQSG